MIQEKSKNWIAIIPSFILYNKELTDKDKLVYSVISNLTHEKGFCWASNRYIADLLGCTPTTISRSVNRLNELKYIISNLTKDVNGTNRKIFLPLANNNNPLNKNVKPVKQKQQTNSIDNNIDINNSKLLLEWINKEFNRTFRVLNKSKLNQRLKVFSMEQIKKAILKAYSDEYHKKNNFKYLTPEYFLRNDDNLDKWLNAKNETNERKQFTNKRASVGDYAEKISKEFGW